MSPEEPNLHRFATQGTLHIYSLELAYIILYLYFKILYIDATHFATHTLLL
jgi:hypothetical protein